MEEAEQKAKKEAAEKIKVQEAARLAKEAQEKAKEAAEKAKEAQEKAKEAAAKAKQEAEEKAKEKVKEDAEKELKEEEAVEEANAEEKEKPVGGADLAVSKFKEEIKLLAGMVPGVDADALDMDSLKEMAKKILESQ